MQSAQSNIQVRITQKEHHPSFLTKIATEQSLILLSFTLKTTFNSSSERKYGYFGFTDLKACLQLLILTLAKARFKTQF